MQYAIYAKYAFFLKHLKSLKSLFLAFQMKMFDIYANYFFIIIMHNVAPIQCLPSIMSLPYSAVTLVVLRVKYVVLLFKLREGYICIMVF